MAALLSSCMVDQINQQYLVIWIEGDKFYESFVFPLHTVVKKVLRIHYSTTFYLSCCSQQFPKQNAPSSIYSGYLETAPSWHNFNILLFRCSFSSSFPTNVQPFCTLAWFINIINSLCSVGWRESNLTTSLPILFMLELKTKVSSYESIWLVLPPVLLQTVSTTNYTFVST